jgi:hypothetical protein
VGDETVAILRAHLRIVDLFAVVACNDETFVALTAAAALANCFIIGGATQVVERGAKAVPCFPLRTRKVIRCRGLQRRSICYTHRRRRAGESFYRSRGKPHRIPIPSPLRSASPTVGSLTQAPNATMIVASNFSRQSTNEMAAGNVASDRRTDKLA